MKGHIQRRGKKSWRLKFDLERDPATGRRQTRYITVQGSKKEAQAKLTSVLNELNEGTYVEPAKVSVATYLREWLAGVEHDVSAKTFERYGEIVEKHLIPALGQHKLPRLQPEHLKAAYAQWLSEGRRDGQGGLSARTVGHHHRVLYKALRQAVRWRKVPRNVAEDVDPPRVEGREIAVLDRAELVALLQAARRSTIYEPVLLAATTGLRRGEVLGLRWRDVDLEAGRLTVAQTLEQTRAGLAFKAPKTKRSRRTVTLPALTVEALRAHKARQAEDRLKLGIGQNDHGLVFARYDGEPINPRSFTKEFARLVMRARVRRITFHGLRHTHLSHLIEDGVHPKVASERAGHASIAITLDVYGHVAKGLQEDVARGVDAALRTALEQKP